MFSCEFCEIFKSTFFKRLIPVAASKVYKFTDNNSSNQDLSEIPTNTPRGVYTWFRIFRITSFKANPEIFQFIILKRKLFH